MLSGVLRPIEIVVQRVERELAGLEEERARDAVVLAEALERAAAAIDRHARVLEQLSASLTPVAGLPGAVERSTAAAAALHETLAAVAAAGTPPTREGFLGMRRQRGSAAGPRPDPAAGS